jgi:hypothetical protein
MESLDSWLSFSGLVLVSKLHNVMRDLMDLHIPNFFLIQEKSCQAVMR